MDDVSSQEHLADQVTEAVEAQLSERRAEDDVPDHEAPMAGTSMEKRTPGGLLLQCAVDMPGGHFGGR